MPTKKTGPVIAVVHAERLYELMDSGMLRVDAARQVKHEFGMEQAIPTIIRTCLDLRRLASIPDIKPPIPPELIVPYEDCIVVGDSHMPYIHKAALVAMLQSAKENGPATLILNGDALDFDLYSSYQSMAAPGTLVEADAHRRAIYEIMFALAGAFSKIYVLRGNHDARLLKMAGKKLSLSSVWQMFAVPADEWRDYDGNSYPNLLNIMTITERYYMTMIGGPTGTWRFTHQKNYSTVPGSVPRKIASKLGCNVVGAHTHHLCVTTSGTKDNYYAVEGGCLFDQRKIEYKEMRDTTHPENSVGWVTIRNGVPKTHHFTRGGAA